MSSLTPRTFEFSPIRPSTSKIMAIGLKKLVAGDNTAGSKLDLMYNIAGFQHQTCARSSTG